MNIQLAKALSAISFALASFPVSAQAINWLQENSQHAAATRSSLFQSAWRMRRVDACGAEDDTCGGQNDLPCCASLVCAKVGSYGAQCEPPGKYK